MPICCLEIWWCRWWFAYNSIKDGYIHAGQTTGLGKREIYFATKDFVKPIKIFAELKTKVDFEYDVEVFKDKYWKSMNYFEH